MEIVNNIYFYIIVFLSSNIWNILGQEGDANVNTTSIPASRKPASKYPYQTSGFDSNTVKSGPILIIDKKIIFISNLHYSSSDRSTHFWVGTGIPSSNGSLVLDENSSEDALDSYTGQNIYLKLPGSLTTDKIDYLSIWSSESNANIGHVMLYSNVNDEVRESIPEASGFHQVLHDNKIIFRVPKCCGLHEIYIKSVNYTGCSPSDIDPRIDFDRVFMSNETHIDPDRRMENIEFVPYNYDLKCPENYIRIKLDKSDTYGLIFNSSLIYADIYVQHIYSHGEFCMENINDNGTDVLTCAPDDGGPTTANMPNLYFPFLVISTICFFSSALCYIFLLKPKDVHKQCFIGYSASMTLTFMCLIFLQKLDNACNFIGGLFILFMFCSSVWFTCLCVDLIFVIKSFKKFSDSKRIYYYIGFSLVIPLIFLISSLVPDGVPDIPDSFVKTYGAENINMCHFQDSNVALFFTPIGILILISLGALCYSSYIINTNKTYDSDWLCKRDNFKFMLRSCALIWTTTCIWLIAAIVSIFHITYVLSFAIDLIEASQGIFVLFIFVLNKYTRREILRQLKKKKKSRRGNNARYASLLKTLNKDNCAAVSDECAASISDHEESELKDNKCNNSDHAESGLSENKHHERP